MSNELTDTQQDILDNWHDENDFQKSSVNDIAAMNPQRSKATVSDHLRGMTQGGFLHRSQCGERGGKFMYSITIAGLHAAGYANEPEPEPEPEPIEPEKATANTAEARVVHFAAPPPANDTARVRETIGAPVNLDVQYNPMTNAISIPLGEFFELMRRLGLRQYHGA